MFCYFIDHLAKCGQITESQRNTITLVDAMNKELTKLLHERVVRFVYQKSDGGTREAVGTLKREMCPTIKGGGKPTPEHLQLYFDLEKMQWRSFKKELLITIYK